MTRLRSVLTAFRTRRGDEHAACATTLGYGPRYLHSTGQLHKGGPNTGVFLIVTADAGRRTWRFRASRIHLACWNMAQALGRLPVARTAPAAGLCTCTCPSRDPDLLRRVVQRSALARLVFGEILQRFSLPYVVHRPVYFVSFNVATGTIAVGARPGQRRPRARARRPKRPSS